MKILRIALNTVYQALRMKFALAFIIFLAAVIILVPFVLKSDGTQRGMVQIALAYSMSVLNLVMSLLVVFLSTSLLCADIRDRVVFTLDTKPVHRWQFILGKWLGISLMNAAVLAVIGGGIYGLARYLGRPAAAADGQDYTILRSEVLTARDVSGVSGRPGEREFVVAYNTEHAWLFQGVRPRRGERYVTLRFKQYSAGEDEEISGIWIFGDIEGDYHARALSFPEGEMNEFRVPAEVIGEGGRLAVRWRNLSRGRASVLFPRDDLNVLYTAGTFGANLVRALIMIFIRLSFLAAAGLAASAFLTFPVATLLTLFILLMGLSLPTLVALFMPSPAPGAEALLEHHGLLLFGMRRALAQVLRVLPNFRAYDPVPSLVDGVMITWGSVARAFLSTLMVRTGLTGLIGILIFNRRELAHMGYD